VWTRIGTGLAMEQEHGNIGVAVLSSDKRMLTTDKWQVVFARVIHPPLSAWRLDDFGDCHLSGNKGLVNVVSYVPIDHSGPTSFSWSGAYSPRGPARRTTSR